MFQCWYNAVVLSCIDDNTELPRCRTSQYCMHYLLSVSLWNNLSDPVFYSVGLWVSRATAILFIDLSCSMPFCVLLFFLYLLPLYRLVLWGCGLWTERVQIDLKHRFKRSRPQTGAYTFKGNWNINKYFKAKKYIYIIKYLSGNKYKMRWVIHN